MIAIMDLRPGNYIQAGNADQQRYLRVVGIDLMQKTIQAKEDLQTDIETYAMDQVAGCPLALLTHIIGGLSFDEHALFIKEDTGVWIIHQEGAAISLPHIRHVHQFQNLFRSLTGQELPFNLR